MDGTDGFVKDFRFSGWGVRYTVTTWGSDILSPRTTLFQENSINQISFDQKFRKLGLAQKQHVQNSGEKYNGQNQ